MRDRNGRRDENISVVLEAVPRMLAERIAAELHDASVRGGEPTRVARGDATSAFLC